MTLILGVAHPGAAPARGQLPVAISGMPERRRKGNKMSDDAAINGGIEYQLMASPTITERQQELFYELRAGTRSYTVING